MQRYLVSKGVDLSRTPAPKYQRIATKAELREMQEQGEALNEAEFKRRITAIMNMPAGGTSFDVAKFNEKQKQEKLRQTTGEASPQGKKGPGGMEGGGKKDRRNKK